jgi:hypothetical protein
MVSGNLAADLIQGVLQFLAKMLIDAIIRLKKEGDLKAELALSFEKSLTDTQKSYNEFLYTYFATYGSIVCARQIHFSDPDAQADEIISKLEKKFGIFLKDFKALMNLVEVHKLTLKDVMGKDWVIMEIYLGAFKSKEPDWNFLINNNQILEKIKIEENEAFYTQLTLRLNLFSKKINSPPLTENLIDFSAVYSSRSFIYCIYKCAYRRIKMIKINKR